MMREARAPVMGTARGLFAYVRTVNLMPDLWCSLCGEPLNSRDEIPLGFHVRTWTKVRVPNWDACFHAASGDNARIKRVHEKIGQAEPLLARAYAGDA